MEPEIIAVVADVVSQVVSLTCAPRAVIDKNTTPKPPQVRFRWRRDDMFASEDPGLGLPCCKSSAVRAMQKRSGSASRSDGSGPLSSAQLVVSEDRDFADLS